MKTYLVITSLICCLFFTAGCGNKKKVKVAPASSEIYFRFDSFKIQRNYAQVLDENLIYLRQNPSSVMVLEGHTDHIGSVNYNFDLGDRRARTIKTYLVLKGISPKRLIIASFGEVLPKYKNNFQKNRRVVLRDASD